MSGCMNADGLLIRYVVPALIGALGAAFGAAVAAYALMATTDREVRVEFVKLAVDILRLPPSISDSQIRDWANDVMATYSEVAWTDQIRQDVNEEAALPRASPDAYIVLERTANRDAAQASAAGYRTDGFPAAVYRKQNNLFIVALGPYSDPQEARQVQQAVAAQYTSTHAEIAIWSRVPYVVYP